MGLLKNQNYRELDLLGKVTRSIMKQIPISHYLRTQNTKCFKFKSVQCPAEPGAGHTIIKCQQCQYNSDCIKRDMRVV